MRISARAVVVLCAVLSACDSKPASSPTSGTPAAATGSGAPPPGVPLEGALLTIPPGALDGPAQVTAAGRDPKDYPGATVAGQVWDVRVNGAGHTEFREAATLRVPYDPSLVPAGKFVTLSAWTNGRWEDVPGAVADPATRSVAARVWHLSEYAPTVTDAEVRIVARWFGTYVFELRKPRSPQGPPLWHSTPFTSVRTARIVAREEVLKLGDWGDIRRFVVESVRITFSRSASFAEVLDKVYRLGEAVTVSHSKNERDLWMPIEPEYRARMEQQREEAARLKAEADALAAALPDAANRSDAEIALKQAQEAAVTALWSLKALEFRSYRSLCDFSAGDGDGKTWANASIQHPDFRYVQPYWDLEGGVLERPSGQGVLKTEEQQLVASLGAEGEAGDVIRNERVEETWSEKTTFVRARMDGTDPPRELVVKGQVLHRLLCAGADGDDGWIGKPGQDWGNAGPRAIPASGGVKVEAYLADTRAPGPTEPVATATTDASGTFEFRLRATAEQSLRLVATWKNEDAQLHETQELSFPACEPFLFGEALAGTGPLLRLPAVSRSGWVFARYEGQPTRFDLGSTLQGGVLTSEGPRKIQVTFEGPDAILLGTFVRRATHLNQNHNTLQVKVNARLDEIRRLAPGDAAVERRITAAGVGADGKVEVEFKGADVCFLASSLMSLDALGLEAVVLDGNGFCQKIETLAQEIYDTAEARRTAGTAPAVDWDDPRTGSDWPFVDYDSGTDNMDWLLSIGRWRPWQLTSHLKASLEVLYPDLQVEEVLSGNVDVFADAARPDVLRRLGSGGIPIISISHGARGGHLIALMGLVLDASGKPVRWIMCDPYGDLSQHPDQNGYYGTIRNVDLTGHHGAYAPYGVAPRPTAARDGTIASKYYVVLRRSGANPSPAELRAKLLPGGGR